MRTPEAITETLNRLIAHLGADVTHVDQMRRLSGGASQETWKFDAVTPSARRELILRRAASETGTGHDSQAIGLSGEAKVLAELSGENLPVPDVVYVSTPDEPLGDAYIMTCLKGETIPRKILRSICTESDGAQLAQDCGRTLAQLHGLNPERFAFLPTAGCTEQLNQYRDILSSLNVDRPILELALQWLSQNQPDPVKPAFVHGDFRLGNLMVEKARLSGVLDWELCHLGDPREDIGWLAVNSWRFGNTDKRVGGFAGLDVLLDAYNARATTPITAPEIDFWEILGTFKWGVMCLMMYEAFRNGSDPTIGRAAIGRRTSEAEIDLVNLLESRA